VTAPSLDPKKREPPYCGCSVVNDSSRSDNGAIELCELHRSAPDLAHRLAEREEEIAELERRLVYAEEFHGYTYRAYKLRQERVAESAALAKGEG
jgi:hypothetical protein